MNGIKDVCFANSVIPYKAVHFRGKLKFGLLIVFKISKRELFKIHMSVFTFLTTVANLIITESKVKKKFSN
jgi:hypothetical protein